MITASSLISCLWRGCAPGSRRGGARKRRAASQPRLELLEGRVVLSSGYKLTDLGTLGGGMSWPTGLNNRGQVVGWSYTVDNSYERAFVDSRGKMRSLKAIPDGDSEATGINDLGQIVGYSQSVSLSTEAEIFLYSHGRVKEIANSSDLPLMLSINDRDQVIGLSSKDGDAELLSGGRLTDLGSLNGHGSVALGINNHGTVVGYSQLTLPVIDPLPIITRPGSATLPIEPVNPSIDHAFIYRHGRMTDLRTLGGSSAEAMAINNHGEVAGWSDTTGDVAEHAFVYRNGEMTDLGTLGGSESAATAINDRGQVVGWTQIAGTYQAHQFLYSNGQMVDLTALFPTLEQVVGINNRGQILGLGMNGNGEEVALLLTTSKNGLGLSAVSGYTSRPIGSGRDLLPLATKGVHAMYKILGTTGAALVAMSDRRLGRRFPCSTGPAASEGAAAKAGEKLDELGRAIRRSIIDAEDTVREGLNRTGETVRDGFARTKESVQGMGLVPRVYGRLHWDKALHASPLFVKAEGGTVTIRGTVPDEAAKAKVISLVKDTFGVTRVIVQLTCRLAEPCHDEHNGQSPDPRQPPSQKRLSNPTDRGTSDEHLASLNRKSLAASAEFLSYRVCRWDARSIPQLCEHPNFSIHQISSFYLEP